MNTDLFFLYEVTFLEVNYIESFIRIRHSNHNFTEPSESLLAKKIQKSALKLNPS